MDSMEQSIKFSGACRFCTLYPAYFTKLLLYELVTIVFLKIAGSTSIQPVDDILLLPQDDYHNIPHVQTRSSASKFKLRKLNLPTRFNVNFSYLTQ